MVLVKPFELFLKFNVGPTYNSFYNIYYCYRYITIKQYYYYILDSKLKEKDTPLGLLIAIIASSTVVP